MIQKKMREASVIKLFILSLIAMVTFFSCSPEQKLANLHKNHPELFKSDTIKKIDTIITKGSTKDSSFFYYQKDTVYINKEKLHIKYSINHDTVKIIGKCDPDTIYKNVPIYVNNKFEESSLSTKDKIILWIYNNALVLIFIMILIYLIIKNKKLI